MPPNSLLISCRGTHSARASVPEDRRVHCDPRQAALPSDVSAHHSSAALIASQERIRRQDHRPGRPTPGELQAAAPRATAAPVPAPLAGLPFVKPVAAAGSTIMDPLMFAVSKSRRVNSSLSFKLFSMAAAGQGRRHDHETTIDHALMRGLVAAGPVIRRGAASVWFPASDEFRLIVPARVLLAVTVPPALLSIGCVVTYGEFPLECFSYQSRPFREPWAVPVWRSPR